MQTGNDAIEKGAELEVVKLKEGTGQAWLP